MGQVIRVSLPGFNALTETDINNYALYSDSDNILLKEQSRGTLSAGGSVNHNLGYIPFYLVYGSVSPGRYMLASGYDTLSGIPRAKVGTATLLTEISAAKYFIFYDEMT